MNEELENAINVLAKKITDSITPDEALKYTQAALNLAHTAATLDNIRPENRATAPNLSHEMRYTTGYSNEQ